MAFEAAFFLFFARLLVLLVPFKFYYRLLGEQGLESQQDGPVDRRAFKAAHTIQVVSRYCFWQCRCLTQAIALKFLLHRRAIACTVYLGVARSDTGLEAHAWVRCGEHILVGAEGREEYSVIARFSEPN